MNCNVLGATMEEIQDGLEHLYDKAGVSFSNVSVFERTLQGGGTKDGCVKSPFTRNNINIENTPKIVQKGISFDLALSKRAGFLFLSKYTKLRPGILKNENCIPHNELLYGPQYFENLR